MKYMLKLNIFQLIYNHYEYYSDYTFPFWSLNNWDSSWLLAILLTRLFNGIWISNESSKVIFHSLEKLYITFMNLNNRIEIKGFVLECLRNYFHCFGLDTELMLNHWGEKEWLISESLRSPLACIPDQPPVLQIS